MSPFRKKRLIGLFLTTVTFALVFANLLPILWMVWCSLKDNGEIMSGKVGIGRRRSEVGFLAKSGSDWLAGSTDGSIGRFRETAAGLERVQAESFGSFATSWAHEGGELWSFSADKGLRRHDTGFAVVQTWDMAALKEAWVRDRPGVEWKTVWVNDVSGTSVVATRTHVVAALRMESGARLVVLDKVRGHLQFPRQGMMAQADQMFSIPGSDELLVVGRAGMARWKPGAERAVVELAWGQLGLPWERPRALLPVDGQRVALIEGGRARFWSWDLGQGGNDSVGGESLDESIQAVARGVEPGSLVALGGRGLGGLSNRGTEESTAAAASWSWREQDSVGSGTVLAAIAGRILTGDGEGRLRLFETSAGSRLREVGTASLPQPRLYVHWRNYIDLWRNLPFGTYLMNSLLICGSVMVISMVLASMAGYALARFEFGGKEIFGYSILATQMIPGILFLIPLYILFTRAGEATGVAIVGSRWGLVLLYSAFYVPFTIWILRGFFAAIPKELEEAALVDGCTPFKAFWSVVLPAALPGIVASGIYVFLTVWDELMFAWILTNAETSTIPVGIRLFAGNYQNRYDLMMAAATVATLPVMLLFFLMQRRIVSGLTAGAVKG